MTECPCCSHPMVRRFRQKLVYWFCRSCWQPMPEGNFNISSSSRSLSLVTESEKLPKDDSSLPSTRSVSLVPASEKLPKEHSSLPSTRSVSLVTASEKLPKEHYSLPSTSINLATELGIKKEYFSSSIYDYAPT